jgi:hypothetical protein
MQPVMKFVRIKTWFLFAKIITDGSAKVTACVDCYPTYRQIEAVETSAVQGP